MCVRGFRVCNPLGTSACVEGTKSPPTERGGRRTTINEAQNLGHSWDRRSRRFRHRPNVFRNHSRPCGSAGAKCADKRSPASCRHYRLVGALSGQLIAILTIGDVRCAKRYSVPNAGYEILGRWTHRRLRSYPRSSARPVLLGRVNVSIACSSEPIKRSFRFVARRAITNGLFPTAPK